MLNHLMRTAINFLCKIQFWILYLCQSLIQLSWNDDLPDCLEMLAIVYNIQSFFWKSKKKSGNMLSAKSKQQMTFQR